MQSMKKSGIKNKPQNIFCGFLIASSSSLLVAAMGQVYVQEGSLSLSFSHLASKASPTTGSSSNSKQ
ncbi:hypothetical protein BD408DRAFT_422721 [Parasitella parasitica]|nr:hypothetical protein BD408DRAFT_422721 [Parasitella parasitica]